MWLKFVEAPLFTEQLFKVADDEALRRLELELLQNPERGNLIPHTGGLRKVRMKLPGRGKSGGARVIYLYLPDRQIIYYFYLYTKSKKENLTENEKRLLKEAANIIKKEEKL